MNDRNELTALIKLLDDPDYHVHDRVVNRLIELGDPAIEALEKQWEWSAIENQQEKIEKVISQIHLSKIKKEVVNWKLTGGENLLYGAFLVARVQYPELQYDAMNLVIDKIQRDIWLELNDDLTALEKIKVINYFIYTVHKFEISHKKSMTPQQFLINHCLDTHRGSAVLIALIYAEIARRLGLPVYGVHLPKNMILCYYDEDYKEDPNSILFYINPFNKGSVLGHDELKFFLSSVNIEPDPFYFTPCSNMHIIERLVVNLRLAYEALKHYEKADHLNEILKDLKSL